MFERYTEKARRVIFFARYEASQFGANCIETEHLLLGLLRESSIVPSIDSVKYIQQRIRDLTPIRQKISTSVDLPLSHESKRALAYSAEEAEKLKHGYIGPEHMLLGLLREENSLAAKVSQERGLSIESVREALRTRVAEPTENLGAVLQTRLLRYLESLPSGLGVSATGAYIYVRPNGLPATLPFLVIQILSSEDRFCEVLRQIQEYLAVGLRYVWMFDPATHHVYIATHETGLHEFKGDVLCTESPALELPLAEVFA